MKLLKSILLLGSMVLMAAACQREIVAPGAGGQEAVTFSVSLPADTKAIGDGSQINRLIFWAFEGENLAATDTVDVVAGSATVKANLIRGIKYTLCFWADNVIEKDGPFAISENGVVSVDYPSMVNSDRYDCFYASESNYMANAGGKAIVLKRPFAQLNVGISLADTLAASNKGFSCKAAKTQLAFTAPTKLDLKDGSLSDPKFVQNVPCSPAPWDELVEGYTRAAFCYVLADGTHEVLDNVFFYIAGTQYGIQTGIQKVTQDVPVYVNQQTNILGEFLDKTLGGSAQPTPTYTVSIAQSIIDYEETRGSAKLYEGGDTFYQNAYEEGDTFVVYFNPVGRHKLKEFYYLDQNQDPVYPQVDFEESTATFTDMPPYNITIYGSFVIPTIEYDFTKIQGFNDWGTTYGEHVVEYDDATVTFASANRQTSTITDRPVTKGGDVSLVLKGDTMETMEIKAVSFYCKQWGTKAQTITLHYSKDGGSSWISTNITSTNFKVTAPSLASGTNAVKISFSSTSNQVGISSVSFDIELKSN